MKIERAKELQAEIKSLAEQLNDVVQVASSEGLAVELDVTVLHKTHLGETFMQALVPRLSTSVRIRPDLIEL